MDRITSVIIVRCVMLSNYCYTGNLEQTFFHGTAERDTDMSDTTLMVMLNSNADASKGSEGSFIFSVWDAHLRYMFEIDYVFNNQLNNSVVVKGADNFDFVITPAPDVMKTQEPFCAEITITPKFA